MVPNTVQVVPLLPNSREGVTRVRVEETMAHRVVEEIFLEDDMVVVMEWVVAKEEAFLLVDPPDNQFPNCTKQPRLHRVECILQPWHVMLVHRHSHLNHVKLLKSWSSLASNTRILLAKQSPVVANQ